VVVSCFVFWLVGLEVVTEGLLCIFLVFVVVRLLCCLYWIFVWLWCFRRVMMMMGCSCLYLMGVCSFWVYFLDCVSVCDV
jgi:hypothetical protein